MKLKHIVLSGFDLKKKYKSKVKGRSPQPPQKNHFTHGSFLLSAVQKSFQKYEIKRKNSKTTPLDDHVEGIYIEIEGNINDGLKFDSLDNASFNLCNVKTDEKKELITATVFIPNTKKDAFLKKFEQYLATSGDEKPKNLSLISTILNLKIANLECFWTDEKNEFPKDENQKYWWEIWLNKPKNKEISDEEVLNFCKATGASFSGQRINLKRTAIILVEASKKELEKSIFLISNLEELKFVGDSPSFFLDQKPKDNQEWIDDLQTRIVYGPNYQSVKVSILDTGVNYDHPLLSNFIGKSDCCSYGSNAGRWPLYTPFPARNTHGSLQAGIAVYGDLMRALTTSKPITVNYSLESGRILPDFGKNQPQMYGYITQNICYQLELNNSKIKRIFSMAVTANDSTGRPSSWSSAIDNLTFGSKRLFVVSAGNSNNINPSIDNWDNVVLNPIQDPAQAWNAITVGAYTELYSVTDKNYRNWNIVSDPGEVTVSSTTSVLWSWGKNAPIKPEVVFEGGNYLVSSCQTYLDSCDELGVLTTAGNSNFFEIHRDTSAATAKASKYVAEIVSRYPDYWPETHRAILVHAAEWTQQMKDYVQNKGNKTQDKLNMLRTVGYGVPNLDVALNSDANKVTMIIEREIDPFILKKGGDIQFNDMHLHQLPIPQNLSDMVNVSPATNAKLKATLSYFIEPNPSAKIASNKYSYRSVGLIFKVKSPLQKDENFLASINDLENYNDYLGSDSTNEGWMFNNDLRRLGSIHSDVWEGSIADLVNMDKIAVLPIFGWWKNSKNEIDNFKIRYSLVITIDVENQIDIYSGIQNMITNVNKVATPILV